MNEASTYIQSSLNPAILRVILLFLIFGVALYFEKRRPLRKVTQPKIRRVLVNLGVAATAAIMFRFTFYPAVFLVSAVATRNHWGILNFINLPPLVKGIAVVLLLDWTLFYWHWMLHRIPFLWRFHNAHHIDLDVDASTALRFHFGELGLSTFFRSVQVLLVGVSPFELIVFETMITTFAQFHHSNVRLPIVIERALSRLIITPRLHGIHHSIVREETDSNFGTIFSVWDYFHETLCANIPQDEVTIGVPSYRDRDEQGLLGVLLIPFWRQRPWAMPDGSIPKRRPLSAPTRLSP